MRTSSLLPLDVLLEIAARTDPVTLTRCAATCSDLRRRVADPAFRRRLRLRHADRFVPTLLLGHLVGKSDDLLREEDGSAADKVWLVGASAANAATATVSRASDRFRRDPDGRRLRLHKPVASRDGLLLVRTARELRVCDPDAGRSHTLPPEPSCFRGQYVLIVGDGEGGGAAAARPFLVAKVLVSLSEHKRFLEMQTFSSEHGAWGPYTKIRTPQLHGTTCLFRKGLGTPLVVGNSAYFLCLTDAASYVLKLDVRAARVTVTALPGSFPRQTPRWDGLDPMHRYLLATATAGGRPIVLFADGEKISVWAQSEHTLRWEQRTQVGIHRDEIVQFRGSSAQRNVWVSCDRFPIVLEWFAERSGAVLIHMYGNGFFWLDLRSMAIVRHFSSSKYKFVYCPYEMQLSSWAPTFGSTF